MAKERDLLLQASPFPWLPSCLTPLLTPDLYPAALSQYLWSSHRLSTYSMSLWIHSLPFPTLPLAPLGPSQWEGGEGALKKEENGLRVLGPFVYQCPLVTMSLA